MTQPIIDNIDRLVLRRLSRPLGWALTFRSRPENNGLYHQLYSNGRLIDVTDSPAQRSFEITADGLPHELTVVAVASEDRLNDFAASLPQEIQNPSWVYRVRLARDIAYQPGDVLAIYHDDATGQLQPTPAAQHELWPQALPHWSWGFSSFGLGSFGLGGANAPGFGSGAFGCGPFGFDADLIEIDLPLCSEGTHDVAVKIHTRDGDISASTLDQFDAHPPPVSPAALKFTTYDSTTNKLTFSIEE